MGTIETCFEHDCTYKHLLKWECLSQSWGSEVGSLPRLFRNPYCTTPAGALFIRCHSLFNPWNTLRWAVLSEEEDGEV